MWVLLGKLLGTPEVSYTDSVLLVFAARSYGDLSSWHWNPGLGGPGVGLGLLTPEISLPSFYPLYVGERPAHSMFPHLLPVWMDVVSLIP